MGAKQHVPALPRAGAAPERERGAVGGDIDAGRGRATHCLRCAPPIASRRQHQASTSAPRRATPGHRPGERADRRSTAAHPRRRAKTNVPCRSTSRALRSPPNGCRVESSHSPRKRHAVSVSSVMAAPFAYVCRSADPSTRHTPPIWRRSRQAHGDARTALPPAPGGGPQFAAAARARHRTCQFAIRGRPQSRGRKRDETSRKQRTLQDQQHRPARARFRQADSRGGSSALRAVRRDAAAPLEAPHGVSRSCRVQRHRPRGDQVSRPFQPGHVDQIDDRFADVVPRRQRAVRVVVEDTGRSPGFATRAGRQDRASSACRASSAAPRHSDFSDVNARQLAPRRRGCGALSGRELRAAAGRLPRSPAA